MRTSTSLVGSSPSLRSARTRVPCPAEPTLADTFLPFNSGSSVIAEFGGTTTMLSEPLAL
ncbi:Uncharacterised protein [Mycobacteroides abscessus subsp. abscessus]|nr:Uncharacterised protein [Mycobacteroides abscessus subsp. abscessus]